MCAVAAVRTVPALHSGCPLATIDPRAGGNLICSAFGSKPVLTYPESNRDARKGRDR
jgi:hypothetical protein